MVFSPIYSQKHAFVFYFFYTPTSQEKTSRDLFFSGNFCTVSLTKTSSGMLQGCVRRLCLSWLQDMISGCDDTHRHFYLISENYQTSKYKPSQMETKTTF